MSDELDALDAHLNRIYWEGQEARHKHRNVELPKDFGTWVRDAKRLINREIKHLPVDLQAEFKDLMGGKFDRLEKCHERDDDEYLRVLIAGIAENLNIIRQNVALSRGEGFSHTQAQKGKKGAAKRWEAGEARATCKAITGSLAGKRDALGDYAPPAELWPVLFSGLDDARLQPVDHGDLYEYGDGEKIKFDAFRKQIQRLRKE